MPVLSDPSQILRQRSAYDPVMPRHRRLAIVLACDIALVVALLLVGASSGSLAVLAEGIDYVADAAGVALALGALWLARRAPTARRPSGFPRAAAWAALANTAWLAVASVGVSIGAVVRLPRGSQEIEPVPVIVVSAVAALVMGGAVLVLRGGAGGAGGAAGAGAAGGAGGAGGGTETDGAALALRAVLLDTAGDVASAGAVAVVGTVILATGGWHWLDPLIALVIATVVGWRAAVLARVSLRAVRTGVIDLKSP